MTLLLPEVRAYLVAQSLARVPSTAGAAAPMWLEPRKGTPAPGESPGQNATEIGPTLVIAAWPGGGIPPASYESGFREDIVDFEIRARTAPVAHEWEEQARAALIDKRNWSMGAITIIESLLWRPMQLLSHDEQSYTYRMAVWFQRYAT